MLSGGTPKRTNTKFYGGNIPWVTISDFKYAEGDVIYKTDEKLSKEGLKAINGRLFEKGTLLLAMYGSVGKTALLGIDASTNQAILGIRPKDEDILNIKFLKYWLDHNKGFIHSQGQGATLHNISLTIVQRQQIDLPNIEIQNKIVAILDKAKSLSDKREQTISMYDELLRATFLDIFGNPMERPSRWNIHRIKEVIVNISAGTSYTGDDKKVLGADDLGVLKISAVTKGIFDPREYKAVKRSSIHKSIITPNRGDLLFSRANTLELVGATCIVQEDYSNLILPDKLWKIETDEQKMRKVYLHHVLRNKDVRKTFLSIATGSSGSMLNISMDKFKNIEIPVPPIDLQLRFEQEYLCYVRLRNKLLISLQSITNLRNSLSTLAFKGELNFTKSIDLEVLLENDYKFFRLNSDSKSIQILLDRLDKSALNERKFYEPSVYNKAKSFVFNLLKDGLINQVFDKETKQVKLTIV